MAKLYQKVFISPGALVILARRECSESSHVMRHGHAHGQSRDSRRAMSDPAQQSIELGDLLEFVSFLCHSSSLNVGD